MADRYPLVVNSSTSKIQELPAGGNVNLHNNGIVNAGVITATGFDGPIIAGAGSSNVVAGINTTASMHVGGDTSSSEDLVVTGNARVTGILTVGTSSLTITDRDINAAGVATCGNFKTGSSNVHSVGIEAAAINSLGADTPIGAGATNTDLTISVAHNQTVIWRVTPSPTTSSSGASTCLLYTSPSPRD